MRCGIVIAIPECGTALNLSLAETIEFFSLGRFLDSNTRYDSENTIIFTRPFQTADAGSSLLLYGAECPQDRVAVEA